MTVSCLCPVLFALVCLLEISVSQLLCSSQPAVLAAYAAPIWISGFVLAITLWSMIAMFLRVSSAPCFLPLHSLHRSQVVRFPASAEAGHTISLRSSGALLFALTLNVRQPAATASL